MESAEEADAAITALNSTDIMGKTITVTKVSSGVLSNHHKSKESPGSPWTWQDPHAWPVLRPAQTS